MPTENDLLTTCRRCRARVEPIVGWVLTKGGDADSTMRLSCPTCQLPIRRVPIKQAGSSKWLRLAPNRPAENLRLFTEEHECIGV
jgi:hypothetical protein